MKRQLFHASSRQIFSIKPHVDRSRHGKHRRLAFAQRSEVVAHAYALKNAAAFIGSNSEEWCFMAVTPERGVDWKTALHKTEKGTGGLIYEVHTGKFKRFNDEEWASKYAARIIPHKTRFITIEDAM